jgi:predicted nuclease of predicted toxin-antitoxin system
MELLLLAIVVLAAAGIWYYNRNSKSLDINQDGKVDTADVKAAVSNAVSGVKETADVNKDGKVDAADAQIVVEKAKTEVKAVAKKAKDTAKKATTRGRKPKAQ